METNYQYNKPEIWGGIECTINRTGDSFKDQLLQCGHYLRNDDIERIASLGITKFRYPVLWEYHQPSPTTKIDWSWTQKQLHKIRDLGMTPIAGLLHHGSGPTFTNLLDPEFPTKLAAYAYKVAQQFPWLEYYTPVNEPLTTARFSALYGLWYPHHNSEQSFLLALWHQVKGISLSMQAIRQINPAAKLVQTEDLSCTQSPPALQYQADYENERRWLTYDLLLGKVNEDHFFWNRFLKAGIAQKDLEDMVNNPCVPEIMGFNYYVTSERYLDDQLSLYPERMHGGNGTHRYADTEAVRVNKNKGVVALLTEAWHRYHKPLAITECHLSCSREEQLRWFMDTWNKCCELNSSGIDLRAVTAWALLGAYDWDSLLTDSRNSYEPGAFDLRGGQVRATAISHMIKSLATTGEFDHPLIQQKGWWQRERIQTLDHPVMKKEKPLLIIGKNGTLGRAFQKICDQRGIPYIAMSRQDMDITRIDNIHQTIREYEPWGIINASGYVKVDDAELNCDECFAINSTGPALLSEASREYGIRFMSFSSDLVFDGIKKEPYHENDAPNPLNVYGSSKAEGEEKSLLNYSDTLIVRTSAFFGPWDRYNFVFTVLESLKEDKLLQLPDDVIVSPTYVPDLANYSLDLFIDGEKGIWHLSNDGMMTWSDFAHSIAELGGYSRTKIQSMPLRELGWKADRPLYSVLQSEKGIRLPSLHHALVRYFEQQEF